MGGCVALRALILKKESVCLSAKDTGFLSVLQVLLEDGTIEGV